MDFDAAQRDLNARFTYRSEQGDRWRILRGTGAVKGDCEDYSLTLIWLAERRSLWRFWWALILCRYVLWHCRVQGEGHLVLWVRGRGWTDNNFRALMPDCPEAYRLCFPYIVPLVALKFALRPVLRRIGGKNGG